MVVNIMANFRQDDGIIDGDNAPEVTEENFRKYLFEQSQEQNTQFTQDEVEKMYGDYFGIPDMNLRTDPVGVIGPGAVSDPYRGLRDNAAAIYGDYTKTIEQGVDSKSCISVSNVRGYLCRSSLLLNWVGLTKILITVIVLLASEAVNKDKCPSCKAPIVGTKPIVVFLLLLFCKCLFKSTLLLKMSMCFLLISGTNLHF